MATFEDVKAMADLTYRTIWNDWYQDILGVKPANHDFRISDLSAGYSHSKNWLHNPIGDGNLDDEDILDDSGWPIWKIQLVHEMLHEYQFKAVRLPSPQGVALQRRFGGSFSGKGHDEKFFTAVAEKANYFDMTPEDLIGRL